MQKFFSFKSSKSFKAAKIAISFISIFSLLSINIPAFAKSLPLSAIPNALYVMTSKDTPAPQTVVPDQNNVDVFHFDLYSRPHEGAKITQIDFLFGSYIDDSVFKSIKLYDFNLKQLLGTSLPTNGHIIFSNLSVDLQKNIPKKLL